jgi:hypothetical protein
MNKLSSLPTGGIAVSAATLEPAVSWALSTIFHAPVPESVAVLVTGVLGSAVHAAYNYVLSRAGVKSLPTTAQQ